MAEARTDSSSSSLNDALRAIVRRRRRLAGTRRALAAAGGWLGALLALIVADAAWALPTGGRWGALLGLVAAAAALAGWCGRGVAAPANVSLGEARRFERDGRVPGHPLVSALQLEAQAPRDADEFSRALVVRSERRALEALKRAEDVLGGERAALRRMGAWLWAATVIWAVAVVIQPTAVSGALARLAWPAESQATAGLTRLEVRIDPAWPVRGEDAQVRVRAHGRTVASAELVELDEARRGVERWPMAAVGEGMFTHTLRNLREPVTYRAEAGGARSRPVTIEPRDPRAPSASRERQRAATDEDEGAGAASVQAQAQPSADASVLEQPVGELAQQAHELGEIADDAGLAQLEAAVAEFEAAVKELEELLDDLAASDAGSLFEALEALALPTVGGVEAAAGADAWRRSVGEAAEADAATLDALEGAVAGGAGPAGEQVIDADDSTPEPPVAEAAVGDYHQWIAAAERTGLEPEAFARQIVPEYRELIASYFHRLGADDRSPEPGPGTDRETEEP